MSRRPWMPLYIGDLARKTMHLGATEFGIYMRLIMHCWERGFFARDDHTISVIAHCSSHLLHKYKTVILSLFTVTEHEIFGSVYTHDKVEEIRARADEISNKRRDAALQKHTKSKSKSQSSKEVSKRRKLYPLPENWHVPEAAIEEASKLAVDWKAEAANFRSHYLSTDARFANWDERFLMWIRRSSKFNGANGHGHGGPRPLQDDSKSASKAAGRLAEAAERGDFSFDPIPSLLPKSGKTPLQLLPKRRGS
jgi:uncharacterized protein YdaU (DUF1376 family)